ncbi:hypothetical protein HNR46_001683 [Haloferula luteola]|uniref:Ice-binding protein C-terminal domain-containing protein n=1 Tax=Haloferula luteola TaxID=595692 RepID=A0A840UZA1_9BACT|nr:PEP-CTERM sorting domain-containing protein [Haloferula luteola]MBB5351447.1 hypothetical protein [Haloferula luteola]
MMKKPNSRRLLLGAISALGWGMCPAAMAVTVNLDFGLTGNHPDGEVTAQYSGTAAAPDGGTVWNEVKVVDDTAFTGPPGEFGFWTTSVTQSGLLDSQGGLTALSVTVQAAGPNGTGAFGILEGTTNLGAVATDAVNLMRDYLIGFEDPRSVEISGFGAGTLVDLYLYGAGDTLNRDTQFSVTDINGLHTATTTGTITTDGGDPQAHTLTLGGDYVVLSGLVADATGTITVFYDNGEGSNEAPFNGLQAMYTVPEPSTCWLGALAGLIGLRRRRA